MEASFYTTRGDTVLCTLCPHSCQIALNAAGRCGVRRNEQGVLQALSYGAVSAVAVDPIEKKPLYHFRPGSAIYSVGSFGCNMRCPFCQNWQISTRAPDGGSVCSPEELVQAAVASGAGAIAYTYSEPVVWFEFVRDCAVIARGKGLSNVMVTNGFLKPEPLHELLPLVDAWNIDLKCFTEDGYRTLGGGLGPVKDTITIVAPAAHLEITMLVVTGFNDSPDEIDRLAGWIASVHPGIPLHLSAYHPAHRYSAPPTDASFLMRAVEIARSHLHYVYPGNIPSRTGNDTLCRRCGKILIERKGYAVTLRSAKLPLCDSCGEPSGIVMGA